jgi:glutamate synthase (NADPH/NADH) large chain
MSGGVAYVWDRAGDFRRRCNLGMVDVEPLVEADDIAEVRDLLGRHIRYTGSVVAEQILARWDSRQLEFVKVMPRDYKRALAAMKRAQELGIPWEQAVMEGAHG